VLKKLITSLFSREINSSRKQTKKLNIPVENDLSDYEQMGVTFPNSPEIIPPRVAGLLREKRYEIEEARQIPRIIEEGERILEIGAGIGLVSTLCAKNPKTESLSVFEADPKLTDYLQRVFSINSLENVHITNGILSNALQGTTKFYIRQPFWSSSLIRGTNGYAEEIDLPVYSFNETLSELRPTLIVCDIEGGELELFEQANLEGVNKLFLEIHQRVLGREGIKRLFDILSAKGFHYDQYHSEKAVILFTHIDRPPAR
jgi:FkbM family methyltransferase